MARPESSTSNKSLRVLSFIDQLPRGVRHAPEIGVADGLLGDQIYGSIKETFHRFGQIQVAVGIIAGGFGVQKTHQKIQITGVGVKIAVRRRAEQIKALDLVPPAQVGQLALLLKSPVESLCVKLSSHADQDEPKSRLQ